MNRRGYTIIKIFIVFIILVVAIGWVKNIIKLSDCDFEDPYKAEIIHAVGIIPPIGAVTGWIDVGQ